MERRQRKVHRRGREKQRRKEQLTVFLSLSLFRSERLSEHARSLLFCRGSSANKRYRQRKRDRQEILRQRQKRTAEHTQTQPGRSQNRERDKQKERSQDMDRHKERNGDRDNDRLRFAALTLHLFQFPHVGDSPLNPLHLLTS